MYKAVASRKKTKYEVFYIGVGGVAKKAATGVGNRIRHHDKTKEEWTPGVTPARPVSLRWETFDEAAVQAGLAGRYAGIQFARSDLAGRQLGHLVADRFWSKAKTYFNSNPTPSTGPSSRTASE